MTRAAAPGAGLRGPGQDVFPEQAREQGRKRGLYNEEVIVLRHTEQNSAGATRYTYVPDSAIRGRIDPVGRIGSGASMGDVINESSSHMVTMDEDVAITAADRVRVRGKEWLITAVREVTDPLVTRVEVRAA